MKTVGPKSSLINVFQIKLNKKWLDGTFDTLVSKGGLEDIDSYVGNKPASIVFMVMYTLIQTETTYS